MWFKRFSHYILQHRIQAILLAFFSTLVGVYLRILLHDAPLLVTLSGIILIMVLVSIGIVLATLITLMKSEIEGAEVALAATLPHLAGIVVPLNTDIASPFVLWLGIGIAVISNILTWVFAVMLRRRTSWSSLLQIAALGSVLAVSIVHLVKPDISDWWTKEILTLQAQASSKLLIAPKVVNPAKTPAIDSSSATIEKPADLKESISLIAQFITGIVCVTLLISAFSQLIAARWWQAFISAPGLLRQELHNIRLSSLTGLLFGLSLVFSYLGNRVVLDIMPILYVLLCSAGLSLVHYLFRLINSKTAYFWLFIFYFTLLFIGSFNAFFQVR